MFPSTDVRFGTECEQNKNPASERTVQDVPAARRMLEITTRFADERTLSEQSELRALVSSSAEARQAYIESMFLQADLHYVFKHIKQERLT
jgi:hypothetical protein